MEILSTETAAFLEAKRFIDTVLLEHRELPDQIFAGRNKLVFFDGNLVTATRELFFATVKIFAEKVNAGGFTLYAHFPVQELFKATPMVAFDLDDNEDTFLSVFRAPLDPVMHASYGALSGMNFIIFNMELKWLIYVDYRTCMGIFYSDSLHMKEVFANTISDYLLQETDARDIASQVYGQPEIEKFTSNYISYAV